MKPSVAQHDTVSTNGSGGEGDRPRDATDQAYSQVLSMITSGALPAGSRLREQILAETVGVSRTPVRAALNRLAAEGLVEMSPHRGAQVASFSPADIAALYDLRARFEPQAALLAVPRLNPEDVANLDDLTTRMEQAIGQQADPERLSALNNAFHGLFVDHCGNRHLAIALRAVVRPGDVVRTFRRYSEADLRRSLLYHRELVAAAQAGDAEWAEALMRAHILSARHVSGDMASEPSHAVNDPGSG